MEKVKEARVCEWEKSWSFLETERMVMGSSLLVVVTRLSSKVLVGFGSFIEIH